MFAAVRFPCGLEDLKRTSIAFFHSPGDQGLDLRLRLVNALLRHPVDPPHDLDQNLAEQYTESDFNNEGHCCALHPTALVL